MLPCKIPGTDAEVEAATSAEATPAVVAVGAGVPAGGSPIPPRPERFVTATGERKPGRGRKRRRRRRRRRRGRR